MTIEDSHEKANVDIYLVKFGKYFSSDIIFYRGYNFKRDANKYLKEHGYRYSKKQDLWTNDDTGIWAKIVSIPFVVC